MPHEYPSHRLLLPFSVCDQFDSSNNHVIIVTNILSEIENYVTSDLELVLRFCKMSLKLPPVIMDNGTG